MTSDALKQPWEMSKEEFSCLVTVEKSPLARTWWIVSIPLLSGAVVMWATQSETREGAIENAHIVCGCYAKGAGVPIHPGLLLRMTGKSLDEAGDLGE